MKYALGLILTVLIQASCTSSDGGLKGTVIGSNPSSTPTATPTPTPAPTPLNCPTNYVLVPADSDLATAQFCMAKYEMRNVGGNAVSQAASVPWAGVSRNVAMAACQAIGTGYDLMLNSQWTAAGRNIVQQGSNWNSGIVGNGFINVGNADYSGSGGICDSTNEYVDVYCTSQSPTGNFSLKRTHTLSNGGVVWDMGGNNYELMKDLSTAGQYGVTGCVSDFTAVNPFSDALGDAKKAFGLLSNAGFSLTGCGNLGGLSGATSDNTVTNRVPIRGGAFYDPAGLLNADIGWADANSTDGSYSFRCVYK